MQCIYTIHIPLLHCRRDIRQLVTTTMCFNNINKAKLWTSYWGSHQRFFKQLWLIYALININRYCVLYNYEFTF